MLPLIAEEQWQHYAPNRRDQRAVCSAPRAGGRPCPPLDHARPTPQTARSSRVGIRRNAASAAGFRLRLGGGTLCFGFISLCASFRPPLHFPHSPTTDRSRSV